MAIDLFVIAFLARMPGHLATVLALRPLPELPDSIRVKVGRDADHSLARALPGHGIGRTDRLFKIVFEQAPLGVMYLDEDGVITAVNPRLVELLGSSREQLRGLHLLTLPDRQMVAAVAQVLRGQRSRFEGEYRSVTGGNLIDIEVHFSPIFDPDGEVAGAVAIIADIRERLHAKRERERLMRQAQEAIRARDEFLSVASHELKTPLTPLSLRLAALERQLTSSGTADVELVRKARASLKKLSMLIGDLLDVARIGSGRLTLHREIVRIGDVVRQALSAHEPTEHPVRVQLPPVPLQICGDPARLEQVVSNLLENAFKYSEPGTPVDVTVEACDGTALIAVRDRGIGIPREQLSQLFDAYFRAGNASRGSVEGLGLGLYIVHDIVARHGGRIWAQSTPGKGSTFFVALPLATAAPPGEQPLAH